MEQIGFLAIPVVVGVIVGMLSGLLGVGGGLIMVPVFRLFFQVSPVMATATSLFTIVPTSISGSISHLRHRTCVLSLGVAAGVGGALTSPIGVWLAQLSPGWMIMLAATLIMGWSGYKMISKALKMKPSKKGGDKDVSKNSNELEETTSSSESDSGSASESSSESAPESAPESASESAPLSSTLKLSKKQLFIGVAIGAAAGLASGYVGVGGGFIMVPLMLTLVGIPMSLASGTSLIAVMILAIPGVIEQALLENINYSIGVAVAAGSIPGAMVGAMLVRRVPERQLRFIFAGCLVLGGIALMLNEFGVLG